VITYKFDLQKTEMLLPEQSATDFTLTKLMDESGYAVGTVSFRAASAADREVSVLSSSCNCKFIQ
jgi:hypothetical protein